MNSNDGALRSQCNPSGCYGVQLLLQQPLQTPRWKGVAWEHIDHCFAEDHAQCKVCSSCVCLPMLENNC